MAQPRLSPFAARLRQLREQAGLTQGQLAERAGLHLSTITRFEQGLRRPGLDTAGALASALGLKVDDLLVQETDAPQTPQKRGRPPKGKAKKK
jgi:transcriptional regulator with XRE-family HTH domain